MGLRLQFTCYVLSLLICLPSVQLVSCKGNKSLPSRATAPQPEVRCPPAMTLSSLSFIMKHGHIYVLQFYFHFSVISVNLKEYQNRDIKLIISESEIKIMVRIIEYRISVKFKSKISEYKNQRASNHCVYVLVLVMHSIQSFSFLVYIQTESHIFISN